MLRSIACLLTCLFLAGCGASTDADARDVEQRVGTPCSSGENFTAFGHYSERETTLADTSEPNLYCLYNHFRGRVSCPFGQTEADLALPETDPARCHTPEGPVVTVEVLPQLSLRQAKDTVHLSCRCDGPDTNATYCGCPTGFECAHLIDDLGFGWDYTGSYCVRAGTLYDKDTDYGPVCDRFASPTDPAYCG